MSSRRLVSLALLLLPLLGAGRARVLHADVVGDTALTADAAQPTAIATGADGALWFTEARANAIGRLLPGANAVEEFPLPVANGYPYALVAGPDGALWFTAANADSIGRVTVAGTVKLFRLPHALRVPVGITVGPDGALWFSEAIGNAIGRITVDGSVSEYPLPARRVPTAITTGPDGALWFTEEVGNGIGRLTLDGTFSDFPLPAANSVPTSIAAGADGALWFAESSNNTIGRITTSGKLTERGVPTLYSNPNGIAAGPDGALWFTELDGNKIGRVTQDGAFAEFPLRTAGRGPFGIVVGPDHALWFTEITGNGIGRETAPYALLTGPAVATVGETVVYTLALTNPTSVDEAIDPPLTFTLPAGGTNVAVSASTLCISTLSSMAGGVSYTPCPGFSVPANTSVTIAIRLTLTQAALPSFPAAAHANGVPQAVTTTVGPLPDTPATRGVLVGSIGCGATDPAGLITDLVQQSVVVHILPCPGAVFLGWTGGACDGTRITPCTIFGGSGPVRANFSFRP